MITPMSNSSEHVAAGRLPAIVFFLFLLLSSSTQHGEANKKAGVGGLYSNGQIKSCCYYLLGFLVSCTAFCLILAISATSWFW